MYKNCFKRLIDFLVALVASPFVLLAVIIMAPIIYINDPGPVFYNATRRGKDGKSFKMFKFRSMYVNSPNLRNADGSTYNAEDDPRVTKVGRFMRKTSIDELPQFFNILIGDMSLVGPRPTLANKPFAEVNPDIRKRFSVRPGVTGYSQAYFRNSITQQEKFEYDCYYADNVSFIMDVKILVKTVMSVLKHENIYVTQEIINGTQEEKIEAK